MARSSTTMRASGVASRLRATSPRRSRRARWPARGGSRAATSTATAVCRSSLPTGRRREDGSIRVKTDVSPAQLAGRGRRRRRHRAAATAGSAYTGTYNLTADRAAGRGRGQARAAMRPAGGARAASRSPASSSSIDKAVLSEGPPDRPSSLAGSLTADLRPRAALLRPRSRRASSTSTARSAKGPTEPIEVGDGGGQSGDVARDDSGPGDGRAASASTCRRSSSAARSSRTSSFDAEPADGGWQIERLPRAPSRSGDARRRRHAVDRRGSVGFGGNVRLAVGQPATFAAWWRGRERGRRGAAARALRPRRPRRPSVRAASSVDVDDDAIGDATHHRPLLPGATSTPARASASSRPTSRPTGSTSSRSGRWPSSSSGRNLSRCGDARRQLRGQARRRGARHRGHHHARRLGRRRLRRRRADGQRTSRSAISAVPASA